MSGSENDCANRSFIGVDPFLVVRANQDMVEIVCHGNRITRQQGNPFDVVQEIMDKLNVYAHFDPSTCFVGAMGYWGYDLRYQLEKLPDKARRDIDIPDLYLIFPHIVIIQDKRTGKYNITIIETDTSGNGTDVVSEKISWLKQVTEGRNHYLEKLPEPLSKCAYSTNFSKEDYIAAIDKTRDYIRRGHIYQVNISQRFTFHFKGSDYLLFKKLFHRNPAPFFAYMSCGDFSILSTSPERFIYRAGDYIETRPIKGTRPRGKNAQEDKAFKEELMESSKEDAELSMIVDLLRNDLGKVCLPGTVKVKEHKRVEAYQNVFHLVSIVEGKLPQATKAAEILKALFPGGSITGCPKIRAMEIIEELETVKRGIYTGSIGYVTLDGRMDLNIAIRTAVRKGEKLYLSVGGGIVYGSDPEAEYMETIHKGETFLELLSKCDSD